VDKWITSGEKGRESLRINSELKKNNLPEPTGHVKRTDNIHRGLKLNKKNM
jgi:hypothetical protein